MDENHYLFHRHRTALVVGSTHTGDTQQQGTGCWGRICHTEKFVSSDGPMGWQEGALHSWAPAPTAGQLPPQSRIETLNKYIQHLLGWAGTGWVRQGSVAHFYFRCLGRKNRKEVRLRPTHPSPAPQFHPSTLGPSRSCRQLITSLIRHEHHTGYTQGDTLGDSCSEGLEAQNAVGRTVPPQTLRAASLPPCRA